MRLKVVVLLLMSTLFLSACDELIIGSQKNHLIEKEDLKELVATYSGNFETEHTASITSTELIVINKDEKEYIYPLPEDEFFVSIAPYKNETHPCTNHSLTSCQGELVGESVYVYIEDEEGDVVVHEKMVTGRNGFIDLWLPRNDTFSVTITQENLEAKAEISTFEDSPTCITTMQLL